MPRFVEEQETVDLHAPWWSDEKDANGRYKERCVVYAQMTEADEQWVNAQAMGGIKVEGRGRKAMQEAMSSLRGLSATRTYLFLRMITELTDSAGRSVTLSKALILKMDKRDAEWINDEMSELYEPDVAPVLEEDVRLADEKNALAESQVARGKPHAEFIDPETIAERHFRGSGETGVPRIVKHGK